MLEPEEILGHVRLAAGRNGPLAGRRVVVTAGGTHEPIDPVRVVANRSSGKQGFAVAQAALTAARRHARGRSVPPADARRGDAHRRRDRPRDGRRRPRSCAADVLVMAAAVADFRAGRPARERRRRRRGPPRRRARAHDRHPRRRHGGARAARVHRRVRRRDGRPPRERAEEAEGKGTALDRRERRDAARGSLRHNGSRGSTPRAWSSALSRVAEKILDRVRRCFAAA